MKGDKVARGRKREPVTVSFHYLVKMVEDDEGEQKAMPIDHDAYRAAMAQLIAMPPPDTSTQAGVDALRFGTTVPVSNVTEIEADMFFGLYKGVYTGHSYENTARGVIPHNSASLRKFYFLIYRSALSGRVYIATQYLGQFGSYTGLKNTITRSFADKKGLEAHSFRNVASSFQKVQAKEIVIEYMRKGKDAGTANSFTGGPTTVVLKRGGGGDQFAAETRKRLFSLFDGPVDKIRTEVSRILKEAQLVAVADDEILNCTVIAEVEGRDRRYHFINDSNFATQFPVAVGLTQDGHPVEDQIKKEMRSLLKDQVLSKAENV